MKPAERWQASQTRAEEKETQKQIDVHEYMCIFLYIQTYLFHFFCGILPLHFDFIIKLLCKLSNAYSIKRKKKRFTLLTVRLDVINAFQLNKELW